LGSLPLFENPGNLLLGEPRTLHLPVSFSSDGLDIVVGGESGVQVR
jgi:hypothetical protein